MNLTIIIKGENPRTREHCDVVYVLGVGVKEPTIPGSSAVSVDKSKVLLRSPPSASPPPPVSSADGRICLVLSGGEGVRFSLLSRGRCN